MQAQMEVGFDELVKMAKELPEKQWTKLKEEVEGKPKTERSREEFIEFLFERAYCNQKTIRNDS